MVLLLEFDELTVRLLPCVLVAMGLFGEETRSPTGAGNKLAVGQIGGGEALESRGCLGSGGGGKADRDDIRLSRRIDF